MKEPYEDFNIRCVEREIIRLFKGRKHMQDDRKQAYCLLSIRKEMLDNWAHQHQYNLLPIIKEFNMALDCALKELYTEAHFLYVSFGTPIKWLLAKPHTYDTRTK